jgi:hypothetical protein
MLERQWLCLKSLFTSETRAALASSVAFGKSCITNPAESQQRVFSRAIKKPDARGVGFQRKCRLASGCATSNKVKVAHLHFAGSAAAAGMGGCAADSVDLRIPGASLDLHHLGALDFRKLLNLSFVLCGHCSSPFSCV